MRTSILRNVGLGGLAAIGLLASAEVASSSKAVVNLGPENVSLNNPCAAPRG